MQNVAYVGKSFPECSGSHARLVQTSEVDPAYAKRKVCGGLFTLCGRVGRHSSTVAVAQELRHTLGNLVAKHIWRQRGIARRRTSALCRAFASMTFADLGRS